MATYRLTSKARDGVRDIIDYVVARFGARVADGVLDRLVAAFMLITENPGAGHRREDVTQDDKIRFWSVGPTLIAYRSSQDLVEILFVERGERDWERIIDA